MNTTPSISETPAGGYTIVGRDRPESAQLSLVVLNRGGRIYRQETFKALTKLGFDEILSVEPPASGMDIEPLVRRFPSIRFLLLHQNQNPGQQINLAIQEAAGDRVMVIFSDIRLVSSSLSSRFLDKIRDEDHLCVIPQISDAKGFLLPTIQAPAFYKRFLRVVPLVPSEDHLPSLFPFDYCGLYQKEKFLALGGYDGAIPNPYWQKMDFGFRAYLWGERIQCHRALRAAYRSDLPTEDNTPDETYRRFFLKNLAVRWSEGKGSLPLRRFLPYLFRTGGGAMTLWSQFQSIRRWVEANQNRFVQDAHGVTELWEAVDR